MPWWEAILFFAAVGFPHRTVPDRAPKLVALASSWKGEERGSGASFRVGPAVVARRRHLPAVRAVLARQRRRRVRRPARHHRAPGPPGLARGGRHLAVTHHAVSGRRLGL